MSPPYLTLFSAPPEWCIDLAASKGVDDDMTQVGGDRHRSCGSGVLGGVRRNGFGTGVYQHCGEQHLQRYLDEFDFRYSNRAALGIDDTERTRRAIKGGECKRLTYRPRSRA